MDGPRIGIFVTHNGALAETTWRDARPLRDVYAALALWKRPGLGMLVTPRTDVSRAAVAWSAVAALVTADRLVAPMPEGRMVRGWRQMALPPRVGIPAGRINDDRFYRGLDVVLPNKSECARADEDGEGAGRHFPPVVEDGEPPSICPSHTGPAPRRHRRCQGHRRIGQFHPEGEY